MKGRLKEERRFVVVHLLWGVRLGGVSCRHLTEVQSIRLEFWFDLYDCIALNVVLQRQIVPIFLDLSSSIN